MFRIIIFFLMVENSVITSKAHQEMNEDEIRSVFGDQNNQVPEYEVVAVMHGSSKNKKNQRILQVLSHEQSMMLYLDPTDGHLAGIKTPVFTASWDPHSKAGVQFKLVPKVFLDNSTFYHDIDNAAALMIDDSSYGKPLIHGIINDKVIRPLPPRLRMEYEKLRREKRNSSQQSDDSSRYDDFEHTHHHIVFKVRSPDELDLFLANGQKMLSNSSTKSNRKNYLPQTIYPQAVIMVDSKLFKTLNSDVNEALNYILPFWNAVDLRYRAFINPKIRINIAGIIFATDPHATPYIHSNLVNVTDQKTLKLNIDLSLRRKSKILFPLTSYKSDENIMKMKYLGLEYDMAITMTSEDLCQFDTECINYTSGDYICDPDLDLVDFYCSSLGLAYYTGACAYDSEQSVMEAVGIVEDRGDFGGIIPIAHEIGHLLGASHSLANEYNCPVNDGYLMSANLTATQNSFVWSNCSFYSIMHFLEREPRAKCLFNEPDVGREITRHLPGSFISRDKLCHMVMGTSSCKDAKKLRRCDKLYCESKYSFDETCDYIRSYAIPEGTLCGEGHLCINGKCVSSTAHKVKLQFGL